MCSENSFQKCYLHKEEQIICRLCLDSRRPLIKACNCSGSIKYVHAQCLTDWIYEQMGDIEFDEVQDIELPDCQLCLSQYDAQFCFDQPEFQLNGLIDVFKSKPMLDWVHIVFVLISLMIIPILWWEGVRQLSDLKQDEDLIITFFACFGFPAAFFIKGAKQIWELRDDFGKCVKQSSYINYFPQQELN